MGCAEGVNYPSQAALCARWMPENEVSRAWAASSMGESVGTILAFVGCPLLQKIGERIKNNIGRMRAGNL